MFTGRRYDDETGLYYYRARYYAPQIGRFMQTDPVALFLQVVSTRRFVREKIPGTYLSAPAVEEFLWNDPIGRFLVADPTGRFLSAHKYGFPVELNLYTYCWNNPIIYVDPYGQLPKGIKDVLNRIKNGLEWLWLRLPKPWGATKPFDVAMIGYKTCSIIKSENRMNDEFKDVFDGKDVYPRFKRRRRRR